MARKFALIKVAIWKSDFRDLTMPEQWLYQALLSQPDLTLAGALMLRTRRWAALAAGITPDDVDQWLRSLEAKQYLLIDWDTDEVLIRTFIKHDGSGGNRLFISGVRSAIERIESDRLRTAAEQALDTKLNPARSVDPSDDESDGSTDGASDDDKPQAVSRKPKASNLNRETSSSKQQPQLPPAAAAAMDIYVEHRVSTEPDVRNARRYGDSIRADEYELNSERLIRYAERGDDPLDIAINVFSLTGVQARTARARLNQREGRAGNGALLECEHCHGDGVWSPNADGHVVDCTCKPVYEPVAPVRHLRGVS